MGRIEPDRQREQEVRLAMVEALLWAVDNWSQVREVADGANSRDEAELALCARFDWPSQTAANVLALRVWYWTALGRQELADEVASLRHRLGLPGGRPKPPGDSLLLPTP